MHNRVVLLTAAAGGFGGALERPFAAEDAQVAPASTLDGADRRDLEQVAKLTPSALASHARRDRAGWDADLVGFLQWICPPMLPAMLRCCERRKFSGGR